MSELTKIYQQMKFMHIARQKKLEPLYLKILRSIGLRPYGIFPQDPNIFKPAYLAKRIGVDPKTIKAHLAGMEKTGFSGSIKCTPTSGILAWKVLRTYFVVMMRTERCD